MATASLLNRLNKATLLIYALIAVIGLVLPTAVTWVYFDLLSTAAPAVQQAAYSLGKAIQFALPAWGWRYRKSGQQAIGQQSNLSDTRNQAVVIDWPEPDYKRSLLWGLASGVAIALTALILYHWVLEPSGWMAGPTEQARAKLKETGLNSLPIFLAVALFYSLCHSGLEEYYWRWFMFRHLTLRCSMAIATVVSSLGFMAHHVLVLARFFGWASPLTYLLALCVAVGGVIWAVLYRKFGTVVGPWLSHAFVDAAIFAIAYQMADWSQ